MIAKTNYGITLQRHCFLNWNHCFYWIAAIWKILDLLQGEDNPDAHHIDDVMKRHLIDYISRLNNICSDDLSVLHSRTHWLMWVSPGLIFLSQFDIYFFFPFTEIYSTCFGIVSFWQCWTIFFLGCQEILLIFIFSKSKKIIGIVIQKSTHYNNPFPCGFYNLRNENVMHELQNYHARYKSRIKDILMLNQSVNI